MSKASEPTPFLSFLGLASRRVVLAGLLTVSGVSVATAQGAFPERPVRLVVPLGPGTGTDTFARQVTANIQSALGQPVVVENKPGANAVLGTDTVVRSTADGYTLLFSTDAVTCIRPALFPNLPFDIKRDLTPVAGLATYEFILVVTAGHPARTVAELVDFAKKNPGTLSVASTAVGSGAHLLGETFAADAGIKITSVQYQTGAAQLFADLIAGRAMAMFYPYQFLKPYLDAGQVRPLAVASAERASYAKDLPTLKELGYNRAKLTSWFAVYAPVGTPADRITRLSNAFRDALQNPELRASSAAVGLNLVYRPPAELAAFEQSEAAGCRTLVELSGVKPQ